jgi:hypothetical protein
MPSRQLQRRVLGPVPDQEMLLATNLFVQPPYTFYYTANLLFHTGKTG